MSKLPLPKNQRRLIYLQIAICLGPLSAIWLLGALFVLPINIGFLIDGLSQGGGVEVLFSSLLTIGLIVAGFLGLLGLARVIRLLAHPDTCSARKWSTRVFVSTGVLTVLGFAIVFLSALVLEWPTEFPLLGFLVYVVLPLFCIIHLLRLTAPLIFGDGRTG